MRQFVNYLIAESLLIFVRHIHQNSSQLHYYPTCTGNMHVAHTFLHKYFLVQLFLAPNRRTQLNCVQVCIRTASNFDARYLNKFFVKFLQCLSGLCHEKDSFASMRASTFTAVLANFWTLQCEP